MVYGQQEQWTDCSKRCSREKMGAAVRRGEGEGVGRATLSSRSDPAARGEHDLG